MASPVCAMSVNATITTVSSRVASCLSGFFSSCLLVFIFFVI
jgi:hypothetical protein